MKTKLFVSVCFYALLLIFLVAIMPSEADETKKSKINIGVHGYAHWLGRGTILQGGDRNTDECGGAIWTGNKEKNNEGYADGIEGHSGKGYVDNAWKKERSWGTGWWGSGRKGGGGGKGDKGGKVGGGGYQLPIPGGGKGGGGKGGRDGKL